MWGLQASFINVKTAFLHGKLIEEITKRGSNQILIVKFLRSRKQSQKAFWAGDPETRISVMGFIVHCKTNLFVVIQRRKE
jgi:hypothetical protein